MRKKVTFFFCIVFLFSVQTWGQTWNLTSVMKAVADSSGVSTLSVSPTSLNFAATGGQQTFTITSNTDWFIASTDTSRIIISPASGSNNGTVTVTIAANLDSVQRTAIILIYGTGVATTQIINVTQDSAVSSAPALSVSPTSLNFAAAGGQQTFTISSNTNWFIACSDTSRIRISPTSGSNNGMVTITIAANLDTIQQTAIIFIYGTGVASTHTIDIIQDPVKDLDVIPDTKPVSSDGKGTIELNLSIPTETSLTGSFEITFPSGMTLDEDLTALVPELAKNFSLLFTNKGNNTWLIEIIADSLRSSTAMELRKIMDIAYKAEEDISMGEYVATITNLDLAMGDGSSIQENELPVIITVANDITSIGNIDNSSFYVCFINNMLKIESPHTETITIYSATGVRLYSAKKDAGIIEIPFSSIPGSVFIVKGSISGTIKVVR